MSRGSLGTGAIRVYEEPVGHLAHLTVFSLTATSGSVAADHPFLHSRGNKMDDSNIIKDRNDNLDKDCKNGNGTIGFRRIDINDMIKWERCMRRMKWNVYMTSAEEEQWIALLLNLVTEDNFNPPVKFPREKYKDFKAFVNSVTTILSYKRRCRKRGVEELDVPWHVYQKRKRLVHAMDKVKEDELLKPQEIVEWQAMLVKLRKGERFSYDEKLLWFKRVAIMKTMNEKQFVPFGESEDFCSLYVSVTEALREMRQIKEHEKIEMNYNVEDEDDCEVMSIEDSPGRDVGAFHHSEETRGATPVSLDLK